MPSKRLTTVDCQSERGLSLIEATIILAVISVLTSVLAPSINDYIQEAKQARAKKDVETIGTALKVMLRDVGETWVMQDGNGTLSTDPPSHAAGNRVDLLVSASGSIPTIGLARSSGSPDWSAAVNDLGIQTLDYHLILNKPSNVAANRYRIATDMTIGFDPTDGSQFNSEFAWRGAYLEGPTGADPWGTRFAVNAEYLAKAPGGAAGNVNDVFVLCAGSDRTTNTRYDTDGVSALGDDIIYVISGSTR